MKKLFIGLSLVSALAVLSVSGCSFLTTEVEYSVSGTATSVTIDYTTKTGQMENVTTPSPWQSNFTLYPNNMPFLAFIRVANGGTDAIRVAIIADGKEVAATSVAAGASDDLYEIVE